MQASPSINLTFVRRFLAQPLGVASPVPSGRVLARRVAEQIDPQTAGSVLELGPGTGAVTAAILARGFNCSRLIAIECDASFAAVLRTNFAGVQIVEGDAFCFRELLERQGCRGGLAAIVSGLPVLTRSADVRTKLVSDAMSLLSRGAPFVQFSYGFRPPLPCPDAVHVEHSAVVWRNIPPMHVWTYRECPRTCA